MQSIICIVVQFDYSNLNLMIWTRLDCNGISDRKSVASNKTSFSIASIYSKLNSKIANGVPIHLQPIDHINASDSNAMQNLHSMNETEPSHLIRFAFLFSLFVLL